jgi:hypothetical protein
MRGILRVPDSWKVGMPGFALDAELIGGRGGNAIQGMMRDGSPGYGSWFLMRRKWSLYPANGWHLSRLYLFLLNAT